MTIFAFAEFVFFSKENARTA